MNRLSRKTKLLYGVAGIGDSALYSLMGNFALFFFTTVAGIDPAVAGAIVAIGAVWDVVSGSFVGYISDKTKSSMGRRKPFLLAATFPLAVCCSLIFIVIDASQAVRYAYYIFMFIAFWTGYSVFFVPYTAWGAELTDNYEERTELRGIVYIFYSIGSAFGTALPPIIVDLLMQWGARVETGWLSVGIFVGVVSAAAIFITGWMVHDSEHMAAADRADNADSADNEELAGSAENSASGGKGRFKGLSAAADILRNYGQVLRFKPARLIVLTSVFYLISNSIMMADRMYFFTYNMELTAKEVSLIMLVMQVVSVLLVPPLIRINRVLDKRTLCIGGIGMSVACLTIYGFIGVSSVPHLLLLFFIYGIGSICYWQLIPSMLYDVCDADKLANGTDRAGLIISMQGLSESVFEAVGFQILGILLHLTGFQTDAARQSLETMQCIHVSFTFIPAFFALLALLMMIRYPITRTKHAEIIKNLQQK